MHWPNVSAIVESSRDRIQVLKTAVSHQHLTWFWDLWNITKQHFVCVSHFLPYDTISCLCNQTCIFLGSSMVQLFSNCHFFLNRTSIYTNFFINNNLTTTLFFNTVTVFLILTNRVLKLEFSLSYFMVLSMFLPLIESFKREGGAYRAVATGTWPWKVRGCQGSSTSRWGAGWTYSN